MTNNQTGPIVAIMARDGDLLVLKCRTDDDEASLKTDRSKMMSMAHALGRAALASSCRDGITRIKFPDAALMTVSSADAARLSQFVIDEVRRLRPRHQLSSQED